MSSDSVFGTATLIYQEQIGSGASSIVFKAFDKRTGEHRAAKVIKDRSKYNLIDLNREINTLKHLNHLNIVKLYGKETEIGTGCDVLILGYCQTSLYSFLQEPENIHGLRDQEFLILFSDLCSGLEYLFINGIIHRDLKPGNILRDTKPDLAPIYIISDFGTSRRLENPEEEFFSLVGTEEFLHPTVYQKAFIDKKQVTPFNSGTDLWSFGCTLFQAISSRVPFIPFGGARNDRTIMFQMVALKPPGCISAYQDSPGGDLVWENRFPENCPMSRNLQEIMKGLVACLMEADNRKQMSHELLFGFQKKLATKFQLEIHLTNDGTTLPLYFDPSNSFAELQEQIAQYTDIPAGRQILFYNDQILENLIQNLNLNELFRQPPSINSLTLLVKHEAKRLTPFKIDPFPVYHNTNTTKKDYQVTTERCEIVNNIKLLVSQSLSFQLNIAKTISAMWIMVKTYVLKIEKKFECLKEINEQIGYQLEIFHLIRRTTREHRSAIWRGLYSRKGHERIADDDEKLKILMEQLTLKLDLLKELVIKMKSKSEKYLHYSQIVVDACTSDCCKKAESYLMKIKVIKDRMKKTKGKEILGEKENIQHLHYRIEAEETCASSLALWQDHCWIHKQQSFNRLKIFERMFIESQEYYKKANIMKVELNGLCQTIKEMFYKILSSLSEKEDRSYVHGELKLLSSGMNKLHLEDDITEPTDVSDAPQHKVNFQDLQFTLGNEHPQKGLEKDKQLYFTVDDKKYLPTREKRGMGSIPVEEQDKRHVTDKSRLDI